MPSESCTRLPPVALESSPLELPILPLGNLLTTDAHSFHRRRRAGLGLFAALPDVLILRVLECVASLPDGFVAARTLCYFSATSTASHVLSADDDLWRRVTFTVYTPAEISLQVPALNTTSWRASLLKMLSGQRWLQGTKATEKRNANGSTSTSDDSGVLACDPGSTTLNSSSIHPSCPNESLLVQAPASHYYYSDILFHKRQCRLMDISPEWIRHDDIPRVSGASMSLDEFRSRFEIPRRPVILTNVANSWPACAQWGGNVDQMADDVGNAVKFNAGGFLFSLHEYLAYCRAVHAWDDQSLFIFDHKFVEKTQSKTATTGKTSSWIDDAYSVPSFFRDDLFSLLTQVDNYKTDTDHENKDIQQQQQQQQKQQKQQRPDFRWLIVGARRSGSSFHKDPNATSAWNAAISGRKKWIFFPPDVVPPGVIPDADQSHVTTPLSITEWFMNFYSRDMVATLGGLEATVHPGEIMFVPRGWWHCVLNLDLTVAITQNFVSQVNVDAVVAWLTENPSQISGCHSPQLASFLSHNFAKLVVHHHPHLKSRLAFALRSARDKLGLQKQRQGEDDAKYDNAVDSGTKSGVSRTKRKAQTSTSSLWESLKTSSSTSSPRPNKLLAVMPSITKESSASKPFCFGFELND